jgi:diguanylate cyclase (GGDEF)-like protein
LIVLFSDDGGLHVQIARDRNGEMLKATADQISQSILQQVRTTLEPLLIGDAMDNIDLKNARSVRSLGLRSVMCVPLISHGQAIGAIYVENRSARNQFQEENLVPLALFAHQVVAAIENARDHETLEARIAERTQALQDANEQLAQQAAVLREQSIRDSLTGLYNRRYYTETVAQQFEVARRYQRPLALAIADIDHFKQINDTLLHAGGDRVLVAVGSILRDHVRQADSVARIGGEEFALVMPETPFAAACQACERLRITLAQHDWEAVAPNLRVTVSVGVAAMDECANAAELMQLADARLYAAKRSGRNRMVADDRDR